MIWVELNLNLRLTDSKPAPCKATSLGIRSIDGKRISCLFSSHLNCTFVLGLEIFSHLHFFFFVEVAFWCVFLNRCQGQILYELKKVITPTELYHMLSFCRFGFVMEN